LPLAFAGLSVGAVMLLIIDAVAGCVGITIGQSEAADPGAAGGWSRLLPLRPADYQYREPEVIRQVVSDWAVMTFTWGKLPGNTESPSMTVSRLQCAIGFRKRPGKPRFCWPLTFAMPSFSTLATEVIPDGVFDGQVSAVLIPQHISPPQAIGEGRWQVDLVATRVVFEASNPSGTTLTVQPTHHGTSR
jgi:hypothetical protein